MSRDDLHQSRRRLLLAAASLSVGGVVASLVPWRDLMSSLSNSTAHSMASGTHLLRGGYFHRPPNYPPGTFYQASTALQRFAFEWDLDSGKNRVLDVSVPTHIADTHPIEKHLSILGTQKTAHIALVDWRAGREIATHELPPGSYFYGHACFTENGAVMLAPLLQGPKNPGIGVFEFPSLKQIDFIPTERGPAHEVCHLGQDQFFFGVATKAMTPNAIGILDLKNRAITYVETGFGNESEKTVVAHVKDCGSNLIANVQLNGIVPVTVRI